MVGKLDSWAFWWHSLFHDQRRGLWGIRKSNDSSTKTQMHAAKCCCTWCADSRCRYRWAACTFMNERHGPLLVLATARRDAASSQTTLGTLVPNVLRFCSRRLGIIPIAPMTVGITLTSTFQSLLISLDICPPLLAPFRWMLNITLLLNESLCSPPSQSRIAFTTQPWQLAHSNKSISKRQTTARNYIKGTTIHTLLESAIALLVSSRQSNTLDNEIDNISWLQTTTTRNRNTRWRISDITWRLYIGWQMTSFAITLYGQYFQMTIIQLPSDIMILA